MRPGSKAITGLAIIAASLAAIALSTLPDRAHTFNPWAPTMEAVHDRAAMQLSNGEVLDVVLDEVEGDPAILRLSVVFRSTGVLQARPRIDWRISDSSGAEVEHVTFDQTVVDAGAVEELIVEWKRPDGIEGPLGSLVEVSLHEIRIAALEIPLEPEGEIAEVEPTAMSAPESSAPESTEAERALDLTDVTETPTSTPEPVETPAGGATETPTATGTETPGAQPTGSPVESADQTATPEPTATQDVTATPETTATAGVTATITEETPAPETEMGAPRIVMAWALPDMQPGTPGVQYQGTGDIEHHDDDSLTPGIQVAPNPGDSPDVRLIEYWLVVEAPGGALGDASASVKVSAPGEAFVEEFQARPVSCADLGLPSDPASVLAAAVGTGQVNRSLAEQVAACDEADQLVLSVVGELSFLDPVGTYRIESEVADQTGPVDTMTSQLESLPVLGLDVGSDDIDFGEISPGVPQEAESPSTVRNIGNTTGYVVVQFSPMIGLNTGAAIEEFGVLSGVDEVSSVVAGTAICLADTIEPNETQELRLSVHPGPVPADRYSGKVSFSISATCPG